MPSRAEREYTLSPISGKKRRIDEVASVDVKVSSSPHLSRYPPTHEVIPTPIFEGEIRELGKDFTQRHIIPKSRRFHDSKRQRVEPFSPTSQNDSFLARHATGNALLERSTNTSPQTYQSPINDTARKESQKKKIDLSPCHICRRKPTSKHELDAFTDCGECGERTCFVCIRECFGLGIAIAGHQGLEFESPIEQEKDPFAFSFEKEETSGSAGKMDIWCGDGEVGGKIQGGIDWGTKRIAKHNTMICSRCCVERGTEGEIWCLGCLRAEGGG